MPFSEPGPDNDYLAEHAALLIESYRRLTGKDLVEPGLSWLDSARSLFESSRAVMSHNTDSDPVFNYGNSTALRLFELGWADFTRLPSRESAEPMNRQARAQLLAEVSRRGFVENYSGIRVSASGRRFLIEDTTIWNLADDEGVYQGQAAVFSRWTDL